MKGFTILEVLVVVAISAMLSVIALTYSSVSRNQVALSVESAKVTQAILRAKNLSISTLANIPGTCGYGVAIDQRNNHYSLFAYSPDPGKYGGRVPPCPSVASSTAGGLSSSTEITEYDQAFWDRPLAAGVKFAPVGSGDDLVDVVFYPPAPTTFLSNDGETFLAPSLVKTLKIKLVTVDGSASTIVTINPAGQVTF